MLPEILNNENELQSLIQRRPQTTNYHPHHKRTMMVATSIDTDTTCRETIDITSLGVSTEDLEGGAQDAAPPVDDSCKKRRISLPNNDRPRAIRWPPRSPLQVARNGWRYLKGMSGPAEIVFLGVSIYVIFYVTGTYQVTRCICDFCCPFYKAKFLYIYA